MIEVEEAISGFGIRDEVVPELAASAQGYCVSNDPHTEPAHHNFEMLSGAYL